MNDQLQTITTILDSYSEFDVANTKKYIIKTHQGDFDLWMTKRDGNQTKAYQDFCGLGELGCQVEIGYKVQQNGEYTNRVIMFMNKKGGNPVNQVDSNLEQRITALESRVSQLESRTIQPSVETSVQDLASQFGGKIVSQTPMPEQGSTDVSTPVNHDDQGIDVNSISF